jgi:hypothetical protein
MTVYVVTGRSRSGTSMMMRAIGRASALVPVVDANRDAALAAKAIDPNYDPNPNGYYTPGDGVLPSTVGDGALIKCQIQQWDRLPIGKPDQYQVIRMVRLEAQRITSLTVGFGRPESADALALIARSEAALMARPDCTVTTVAYGRVIDTSLAEFVRIRNAGWPIVAATAAATVDPLLYRNR